ncbi:hydroxymethylglutaryl-CoA synthase family protein [Salinispira pacifica]|uniref:Hydroxymethylglutaryl-CoA synthase n=1 Tax=Salinispira pacifica TaxID=1307761 RepID=V5WDE8_9SPIO|nr:hydroxymethylglutaryl-CoA synthase [Salinispira pacifica]AHC13848.1 Hydroxymethylglutaryl-CoA synthase [Salinispira pacifica]
MKRVGIEKLNVYGTSMYLDQADLAKARGKDPEQIKKDYLIETRSLNPTWEDAVTMAANAAMTMLSEEDKKDIGMLIVGTEGSVDFGKPISTNVHSALGLGPNVRNYETKFACYSGVAALDTAVNWVASGLNKGKKALVIASDFSRQHLGKLEEFVLGGCAAAALVSDDPKIIEYDLERKGTWTTDIYDTFRPSALAEVGNNEVSLFSYMDAVQGSYEHYKEQVEGDVDFDNDFSYFVYHTPFPGIAFQAHRTLTRENAPKKKPELRADFENRVIPALAYSRRVGSTYGTSNLTGLAALVNHADDAEGKHIALFAYGSGAIGEFYSGTILPGAKAEMAKMKIDERLDERRRCSVEEYEAIEKLRETYVENSDFVPDYSILDGWYEKHYKGSGLLVLKEVKDWYRTYERA